MGTQLLAASHYAPLITLLVLNVKKVRQRFEYWTVFFQQNLNKAYLIWKLYLAVLGTDG